MLVENFQSSDFSAACSANATAPTCRNFVSSRITEITGEAGARKQNALATTYEYLSRTLDMDDNNARTLAALNNGSSVKSFIKAYNEKLGSNIAYDTDVSKRQFEINEYYYHNKLETLFFLQLFFISGLVMAILIYLNNRGLVTPMMAGTATMLLFLIVVFVGITRYFYTKRTRDNRLWHRRYFGTEDESKPDLLKCPGPSVAGPIEVNLNALIDPNVTQCAVEINDQQAAWFDQASKEAQNFIESGAPVSSIFKSSLELPKACRK